MIDISNVFRLGTNHTLSVTDASGGTATSAFGAQTQTVMVTATAGCFVAFDPNRPATVAGSTYIAAGTPYFIRVQGEGSMCSAITGSGTASLYITELTR